MNHGRLPKKPEPTVHFPPVGARAAMGTNQGGRLFITGVWKRVVAKLKALTCTNCSSSFSAASPPLVTPCGHLVCRGCADKGFVGMVSGQTLTSCRICHSVKSACAPANRNPFLERVFTALESDGDMCDLCRGPHPRYNMLQCRACYGAPILCLEHSLNQHRGHHLKLINQIVPPNTRGAVNRLVTLHATVCPDVAGLLQCTSCALLLSSNPSRWTTGVAQLVCGHFVHRSCTSNNRAACSMCADLSVDVLMLNGPPLYLKEIIDGSTVFNCKTCQKDVVDELKNRSNDPTCIFCVLQQLSCTAI